MTDLDLGAIEARIEAATPGPWCYYLGDLWRGAAEALAAFDADPEHAQWPFGDDNGHLFHGDPVREEDAEFIAHARQDVPALVAEVRRLRDHVRECHEFQNNVAAIVGIKTDWDADGRKAVVAAVGRLTGELAEARAQVAWLRGESP